MKDRKVKREKLYNRDAFMKLLCIEVVEVGKGKLFLRLKVADESLNSIGICNGKFRLVCANVDFRTATNSHSVYSVAAKPDMTFSHSALKEWLYAKEREVTDHQSLPDSEVTITNEEGIIFEKKSGNGFRLSD